jgi:hypothetical protein
MPNTYSTIATTTLTSTASTVTFNSFSGYTDLIVVVQPKPTTGGYDFCVQFNGDTGNNYSTTVLTGDGTTASSVRNTNNSRILCSYNGGANQTVNNKIVQIMNYSNSTTFKTVLSRANNAANGVDANVGLWRSTANISSMTFNLQTGGTFDVGSTFTVYGILAA